MEQYLIDKKINQDLQRINHFRDNIMKFEEQLVNLPGSYGDGNSPGQDEEVNKVNPLKHTFAGGCYIREIFMPKGQVITTGIHKKEHPYFILKGKVSVLTENGIEQFRAPHSGITQPGTKRLIYIHQDTLWTTVHATDKTNVEDVMKEIIAEDFDDPLVSIEVMHDKLKLKNK